MSNSRRNSAISEGDEKSSAATTSSTSSSSSVPSGHLGRSDSISSLPETEKLRPGLSLHKSDTSEPSAMAANTWSNIDAGTFSVRIGPGYSRYRRKADSAPSLYDCVSVDLYQTPSKIHHIARIIDLPTSDLSSDDLTDPYLPHIVVVSCQIPNYPVEHAIWGRNPEDGPGFSLVFYYALSAATRQLLAERRERIKEGREAIPFDFETSEESADDHLHLYTEEKMRQWEGLDDRDLPPPIRLLHRFVTAENDPETGDRHFIRDRFKGIARISNLDAANIATAPRKLIQTYNSTPFLIRTTSTFYNDPKGENRYFEVDVDVHRFGYLARLGLSGVRERIKDVVFDWAFVIEGHTDEELPENILSAARLSQLEMTAALQLPEKFLPYMT